jgi:hypothetical protein
MIFLDNAMQMKSPRDSSERSFSEAEQHYAAQVSSSEAIGFQTTLDPLLRIFRTIPPERVGLHGEYDHHGLAKRVALAFSEQFEPNELADLRITQRGTVVVLVGNCANEWLMTRLVNAAFSVEGAADVEINGVSTVKPLRFYLRESECFNPVSQAC